MFNRAGSGAQEADLKIGHYKEGYCFCGSGSWRMREILRMVRLPRSGDSMVVRRPRAETCLSARGSSLAEGAATSMDLTAWESMVSSVSSSMVQPVDSPPMAMARVSLPVTVMDFEGWVLLVACGNARVATKRRRKKRRRDLVFTMRGL
jgi:hypothetical protein